MTSITQQEFRQALGQFATGITIITARDHDGTPIGMTANCFASISLQPPLVLWSADNASPLYSGFAVAKHCAIHLLGDEQQALSHRFAQDADDKFDGLKVRPGIANLPLLEQHISLLQCEVIDRHEVGDHLVMISQVLDIQHESGSPLLYFSGEYRRLQT